MEHGLDRRPVPRHRPRRASGPAARRAPRRGVLDAAVPAGVLGAAHADDRVEPGARRPRAAVRPRAGVPPVELREPPPARTALRRCADAHGARALQPDTRRLRALLTGAVALAVLPAGRATGWSGYRLVVPCGSRCRQWVVCGEMPRVVDWGEATSRESSRGGHFVKRVIALREVSSDLRTDETGRSGRADVKRSRISTDVRYTDVTETVVLTATKTTFGCADSLKKTLML